MIPSTPPPFAQIAVADNPHGTHASLYALDEAGDVWQYIATPKHGAPYWLRLATERRDPR